jgi:SAM-dependent methyltransferase
MNLTKFRGKINLGCGRDRKEGYLNIDVLPGVNPDLVLNLMEFPWPIPASQVEKIVCDNLLEHIPRSIGLTYQPQEDPLRDFLNECHRVLIPGGHMWFRVPDFLRWPVGALRDPTHTRFFVHDFERNIGSFDYWNIEHPTYKNYGASYGYKPWRIALISPFGEDGGNCFLDVTMEAAGK